MRVVSDRHYTFGVEPDRFWSLIADVDGYRGWWPWLRSFDAHALDRGERWRCTVQPPVPYTVRFTVTLDELDPPRSISASITGDIVGVAQLDVTPCDDGSQVRLRSALGPNNHLLRIVAATARPLVQFGHNWVLDTGARQFAERAANPAG
ncbi:MAG: SRPBCC family protein [Acidimicrobiia bacterium]